MYKYNDTFCKSDGACMPNTQCKEAHKPKQSIDEIFAFLSTTSSQTPYYKVIHKQDLSASQKECAPLAKQISENFDSYVFLGMGGAILNPMMMYSIANNNGKKVHFINTTDPSKFSRVFSEIKLDKTAFIIISNSGETSETISLLGATITEFKRASLDFAKNLFFCVGQNESSLRSFATKYDIPIVEYDVNVGGRFSCFSNASVLPAMLAGLNLEKLQAGANAVVEDFWQNRQASQPGKAALSILKTQKPNLVALSYNHNLDAYLEWYCQIISESLGKNNIGYTPLRGIGPQEQHSMLQLYLDGPQDKLYTLIYVKPSGDTDAIKVANQVFDGHFLEAKKLSTVNRALFEATSRCLITKGLPLRTLELDGLNEENMGALIMHSSIEVIFLGLMMGLNPFDQPGVEAIKVEARKILAA